MAMIIDNVYVAEGGVRSAVVQHHRGSPLVWLRLTHEGEYLGDMPYNSLREARDAGLLWAREGINHDLESLIHATH